MSLSVGIVGLPNSGKSTLFNALLRRQIAQVAEYPYTTIEPNVGVVEVPDERLQKIADCIAKKADPSTSLRTNRPQVVPAAIRFIDIAGLIKGAHQGEGLGNQFLGHIREVDALLHIVRAFENLKVPHVSGRIDPMTDVETVNAELEMAGIEKPTIYVLNVDEKSITENGGVKGSKSIEGIKSIKGTKGSEQDAVVIPICAKLEAELAELSGEEQKAYLEEIGIDPSTSSGFSQVISESFKLLDLITFFTVVGGKQIQAWPIKKGLTMIEAAELVHTDMARGFITAEVCDWQKLVEAGSWHNAKEKGVVHLAGRSEEVVDGEVVEFKFNV